MLSIPTQHRYPDSGSRPLSEIWLGTQKNRLTVIATLQRYPLQDAALATEVSSLRASQSLFAPFVSLRICENSASTMDLVWNNWTKITTEKLAYATGNDDEKDHMYRVLRSTWERVSVAALVFMPGCVTTAVVMQMRSSYVLAFDTLADHRRHNLFLQTIRTGPTKGLSVPFNKAYLLPGRNKTEFMIRVDGKPTRQYIPLDDKYFIDGKKVSLQRRVKMSRVRGDRRGFRRRLQIPSWGPVIYLSIYLEAVAVVIYLDDN
ncbi:hypothetical protein EDD85DRAFT_72769 [Armillaria nabsnona]|nr:hypothetical protein EDD85DRAFT_72769 [Armillaria nabsnona]